MPKPFRHSHWDISSSGRRSGWEAGPRKWHSPTRRGLARIYAPLASGGTAGGERLLSEASAERAGRQEVDAKDVVTGKYEKRTLGFMPPEPELGDPRPPTAFGHLGMGSSIGSADPPRRLAMGYVMNKMIFGLDRRYVRLGRAVYGCLDAFSGNNPA